jgi:uncharacterized RDD family membrane protein YckC
MLKLKFLFFFISFIILSVKGFSEESNYEGLAKKKLNLQEFDCDTLKRDMYEGIEEANKKLYQKLVGSGRVTESQIGDYETFNTMLQDPENGVKLYNNLRKNDLFKKEEIGDQETFLSLIETHKQAERNDYGKFDTEAAGKKAISETTRIGYKEFARIIKAKYPQYSDVDDMELAKIMIEKYPVYGEKVNFSDKNKIDYDLFDKEAVEKKQYPDWLFEGLDTEKFETEPASDNNSLRSFQHNGQVFDIPEAKVQEFLADMPEAQEIRSYSVDKDTFDIPINKVQEFLKDVPRAKPLHDYTQQINYGSFDKETEEKKQYPDWLNDYKKKFGFVQKSNEEKNKKDNSEKTIQQELDELRKLYTPPKSENPVYGSETNIIFKIDKIKVGDTEIEIPIPNEFVKIDDSFKEQLEIANTLVPNTNTLLSYYLSEKDFGDLLTDGFHQSDKYIMIQVFNELKYKKVGLKDYQKFLKSYKKDFFIQFGQQFQENALETVQDISKSLDADIDFEKIGMFPLGIYYESKNSLSTGVLSKINYLYSGTTSHENIVASVSTVTKIDGKVVFLYLFKKYNNKADLEWIKATNETWIKEIEKQQSPTNLFSDFDFAEFREVIMAILFLSFIGASYYATKKIYKKYKPNKPQKQTIMQKKDEFIDFTELLNNDEFKTKPRISNPIRHPELLKANRRLRFANFLIDSIFIYTGAFLIGYSIGGTNLAQIYFEHPYLAGAGITFILYFFQELLFGKTLGKLITGTNIVNDKGQKPSIMQLILRNASRLIPFEAFTYLSKEKRGLHDIISKTYVIKN